MLYFHSEWAWKWYRNNVWMNEGKKTTQLTSARNTMQRLCGVLAFFHFWLVSVRFSDPSLTETIFQKKLFPSVYLPFLIVLLIPSKKQDERVYCSGDEHFWHGGMKAFLVLGTNAWKTSVQNLAKHTQLHSSCQRLSNKWLWDDCFSQVPNSENGQYLSRFRAHLRVSYTHKICTQGSSLLDWMVFK